MAQKLLLLALVLARCLDQGGAIRSGYRKLAEFSSSDPLMRYLAPLTFGSDPGPCPNRNQKCTATWDELQDSSRRRVLQEELIRDGVFSIYDLTCSSIDFERMTFTIPENDPYIISNGRKSAAKIGFELEDLRLDCFMRGEVQDLVLDVGLFGGSTSLDSIDDITIVLDKSEMIGRDGLSLFADMQFASSDLDAKFPTFMDFITPGGSREDSCRASVGDGLKITVDLNLGFFGGFINAIVNQLLKLFDSFIEQLFCIMLRNLAFEGSVSANNRGILNRVIKDLSDTVIGYEAEGINHDGDFLSTQSSLIRSLTSQGIINLGKDLDFSESSAFKEYRLAANNFLNSPSSTGNGIVMNDALELLFSRENGVFLVEDVVEFFNLQAYPVFKFPFAITQTAVVMKGFQFSGLDKFTSVDLLSNKFDEGSSQFDYSVKTQLSMSSFTASINFDLIFEPGEWVTAPNNPRSSDPINFNFVMGFQDFDVSFANFMLYQPELFNKMQIGQLLGPQGTLETLVDCTAQLFDYLSFSGIDMEYTALDAPFSSGATDLAAFVKETLDAFNLAAYGGLNVNLPFIVENLIRVEMNKVLNNFFTDAANGLNTCPTYFSQNFQVASFDLHDFVFVSPFSNLILNVIGGDPIEASDGSINSLFNALLLQLLVEADEPLYGDSIKSPSEGTYKVDENILVQSFFNNNVDSLTMDVKGPTFANVDCFGRLLFFPVQRNGQTDPFALSVEAQYGHYQGSSVQQQPLHVSMPVALNSVLSGVVRADADFVVDFLLSVDIAFLGTMEIDKDRSFLATFGMILNHLACTFALLNSKELEQISLSLREASLNIIPASGFNTNTKFGLSLSNVQGELEGNRAFVDHVVDYFLDRVEEESLKLFNSDPDGTFDLSTCTTVESPLSDTSFAVPLPSIDIAAINEFLNEATTQQDSPRGQLPSVFEQPVLDRIGNSDDVFDITNKADSYLEIFSGAVTPASIKGFMFSMAQRTIDPANPSAFDAFTRALTFEEPTTPGGEGSISMEFDVGETLGINYNPEQEPLIEGLKILFHPLKLRNVQNFRDLDILKPYTAQGKKAKMTTSNDFFYGGGELSAEMDIEFQIASEVVDVNGNLGNTILTETLKIVVDFAEVDVAMLVTAAFSEEKIKDSFVGDFVTFDVATQLPSVRSEGLYCVFPNLIYQRGIVFPQFQMNFPGSSAIGDAFNVTVTSTGNLFSDGLVQLVEAFTEIMVETFTNQLPNFTQGPIRDFLDEMMAQMLADAESDSCKDYQDELPDTSSLPLGDVFNFHDSNLDTIINTDFIEEELLDPSSPLYINNILKSTSVVLSGFGKIELLDPETEIVIDGNKFGHGQVNVGQFRLPELGATNGAVVTGLKLFDNSPFSSNEPTTVRHKIQFAGPAKSEFRFGFTFDQVFEPEGSTSRSANRKQADFVQPLGPGYVYNDVVVETTLFDLEITFDIDMKIDIIALLNLNIGNILNLYSTPNEFNCFFSVFEPGGLVTKNLEVTFETASMTFDCATKCNSPILALLELGPVTSNNDVSVFVTDTLKKSIEFLELFVAAGSSPDSFLTETLNKTIIQARQECIGLDVAIPALPPDITTANGAAVILFIALVVYAILGMFFLYLSFKHQRARAEILKSKKNLDKLKLYPLMLHPEVSKEARWTIALMGAGSTALLILASFFTKNATVFFKGDVFGSKTVDIALYDFTLESTINDAWTSRAYGLALAIALSAGIIPYTKLILMTFAAFAPPTVLKPLIRTKLLLLVDRFGKWSLLTTFVIILLQIAFRLHGTTNAVSMFSLENTILEDYGELGTIDLFVVPKFATIALPLSVMFSTMTSHFLLLLNKKAREYDEEEVRAAMGYESVLGVTAGKKPITKHVFFVTKNLTPNEMKAQFALNGARGLVDKRSTTAVRREVRILAAAALALIFVFTTFSLFLDAIVFELSGVGDIFSVLNPALAGSSISPARIVSAIADYPGRDSNGNVIAFLLQMIYVIFVMLGPFMLMMTLASLLFSKGSIQSQITISFLARLMNAWEALLILVFALFAAVLQINTYAKFVVEDAFGNVCTFMEDQFSSLGFSTGTSNCIDIDAAFSPSGFVLIFMAILLVIFKYAAYAFAEVVVENKIVHGEFNRAQDANNYPNLKHILETNVNPEEQTGFVRKLMFKVGVKQYGKWSKTKSLHRQQSGIASANPRFTQSSRIQKQRSKTEIKILDDELDDFLDMPATAPPTTLQPDVPAPPAQANINDTSFATASKIEYLDE